jgi:proliferating cell nuclear antigen
VQDPFITAAKAAAEERAAAQLPVEVPAQLPVEAPAQVPVEAAAQLPVNPYRLEIKTVQAPVIKVLVEALKELLTDTSIEFDETGVKILTTDTSHVVMVHLKLDASKFEVYHCEGRISIGVNMLNFHKLLKTINNNNTLSLFMDRDDFNHLGIKIENSEKNTRTVYKLNLLDLDHHNLLVDPLAFPEVVTLPSSDFQKICRDMHNLADDMEIRSVNNQLIFSCKGDYCSQETVIRETGGGPSGGGVTAMLGNNGAAAAAAGAAGGGNGGIGAGTGNNNIVQGVFSIKHLVLFTKCTNLCPTMELYLANNYPLVVKYDVSSLGAIRLVLAPQLSPP